MYFFEGFLSKPRLVIDVSQNHAFWGKKLENINFCFQSSTSSIKMRMSLNPNIEETTKVTFTKFQQPNNRIFTCKFDFSPFVLGNTSLFPGYSLFEANRPCLSIDSSSESFEDFKLLRGTPFDSFVS